MYIENKGHVLSNSSGKTNVNRSNNANLKSVFLKIRLIVNNEDMGLYLKYQVPSNVTLR